LLKPIVVEATRSTKNIEQTPFSISLNRYDRFNGNKGSSLDQVLEPISGVFLQNPFNFAQDLRIAIRGFGVRSSFGVRGIKVLSDGFSESLADGSTPLDSIDPDLIESVEVLKGPGSSLYGNSVGGAVLFKTRSGPDNGTEFSSKIKVGQFGLFKKQIEFGQGGEFGSYRFYASDLQFDGFREHSETKSSLANFKAHYIPDTKSKLTFLLGYLNSPKSHDPGALTASQAEVDPRQARSINVRFEAGEKVRQHNIGIKYETELIEGVNVSAKLGGTQRFFSNKLPFENGGAVDLNRNALNAGSKIVSNWRYSNLKIRSIAGIDLLAQLDDRKRFDNVQGEKGPLSFDQNEDVTSYGIYFRNEIGIQEDFEVGLGVRYDRTRFQIRDHFDIDGDQSGARNLDAWSGSVGAVWQVYKNFNIFGNFSTAFETPAVIELTNNPSGLGGLNSDLEPRYSFSYETGIKGYIGSSLSYEASVFLVRTRDEIVSFELSQSPGRSFFRNSGNSERVGSELALFYKIAANLNFQLSYTYSNFKFRDFLDGTLELNDKKIPGIPLNYLFAKMKWSSPSGLFAVWKGKYVDELFANRENTFVTPDYFLADFQVGIEKEWGEFQGSLFAGIENAADSNYFSNTRINASREAFFEPGSPMSWRGGLQISFRKKKI
jgi:iron complex outermembrane recepter protein